MPPCLHTACTVSVPVAWKRALSRYIFFCQQDLVLACLHDYASSLHMPRKVLGCQDTTVPLEFFLRNVTALMAISALSL